MATNRQNHREDSAIFDAYVSLRRVAQQYNLEDKLSIPRVVFVGETSSGKSMLVQNFLGFACAFSKSDVGTRCPVLYRLRYNPNLSDGKIVVKHPPNIDRPEKLAPHLAEVMSQLGRENRFSCDEYLVHIEGKHYRDFEILDVPGLIGGSRDEDRIEAVERITEHYVRDPRFLIVQLKEATQIPENCTGLKRISELCCAKPSIRGSPFPARPDYGKSTITIQTKLDAFMDRYKSLSSASSEMDRLIDYFDKKTLFTSMILDAYEFSAMNDEQNTRYIRALPALEEDRVNQWIRNLGGLDASRYRPLIGINVVRNRIQDMWVDAFRGALPNILNTLQQLVQESKNQYENLVSIVGEKDFDTIRKAYQGYIAEFRRTIREYVAYRHEVHNFFDIETYGRTYPQIEAEYNQWPRKHPLVWSAHQTADQLSKASIPHFQDSLIGASHFRRIRNVFFQMLLTYQPKEKTAGWLESAASLLHGVTADHENAEKMAREWLRSYISEAFGIGVCWLTQIYTFLLEQFETHVNEVLLSRIDRFGLLSRGHGKFFNLFRLEYHQTTRAMLRRAVEATRYARHAKMTYVSHSICHFLRTLMESIPPTVRTDENTSIVLVDPDPARLIYSTTKFLPENRNQQTSNYIPPTRNVVHELFTTARGLLLHEITTYFYANVVAEIQEYQSIEAKTSLELRVGRMDNEQIARLSQIDFDEQIRELESIFHRMTALENANEEIMEAIRVFDGKQDKRSDLNLSYHERCEDRHKKILKNLYQVKDRQRDIEVIKEEISSEQVMDEEQELTMKLNDDPASGRLHLAEAFRKHDLEDLKLGLLRGEDLQMNAKKGNPTEPVRAEPHRIEPTASPSNAPTTVNNAEQDATIDQPTEPIPPRSNPEKPKINWVGGTLGKR